MTTVATLWVELGLDSSKYHKGLTDATSSTSGLGGVMQSVGNIAGTVLKAGFIAAAAGAVALGKGIFDSVQAAAEAQDVQAQLNAVLESTGGIAGVTADEVNRLADTLSGVTKFEDEAIISGENLLLTFTNIGKDIFPEATEVMLDMSQALGQDLKSSAIQLGKALQDPVLGVTALRRVGVNFNDEQKKMIESMVEAGDVAGAQAFILKELQTEFGGSARAAGSTFAGQLEILKNALGNVKETIGAALLPLLTSLVGHFKDLILSPEFQAGLERFTTWITNEAVPWVENKLLPTLDKIIAFFEDPPTTEEFLAAIDKFLADIWNKFIKWLDEIDWLSVGKSISDGIVTAIESVDWTANGIKFGEFLRQMFGISKDISDGFDWTSIITSPIIAAGEFLAGWFAGFWGVEVSGSYEEAIEQWKSFFTGFGDWIENQTTIIGDRFMNWWDGIMDWWRSVTQDFFTNNPFAGNSAAPADVSVGTPVHGFASGGSFTVPPGFSGDSFPMRVSSGEQVSVTPPGQNNNGGMSDQQLKTLAKYIGMEFSKVMG
jgi:hypothetical protein